MEKVCENFGFRYSTNLNRACLYSLLVKSYCSESLKCLGWFCLCVGAMMKLENDAKSGQGRGAFNPATRVQIPMGATYLWVYYYNPKNSSNASSSFFGLPNPISAVSPSLSFISLLTKSISYFFTFLCGLFVVKATHPYLSNML